MGARHTVFFGKPAMRMVGAAPHKSGWCRDESRSDNSNKQVCICDICYKQIHVRKQISIMCNRIEHWVHLRSSGIHQAQYTDTRTCHLHRESRLTTHTYITPPHPSRPWSKQWVDNNNSSYEKYLPLQDDCSWGEGDGHSSNVLAGLDCWIWFSGRCDAALIEGKNIVSVPRHDGFLVDMVNDGL